MIGFATLPEQVHRKTVKRGFDFTLLVVGEAGLGKSTLVNSLFLTDLYKDRKRPTVDGEIRSIREEVQPTAKVLHWELSFFHMRIIELSITL